ncbi:MAG: DinB family protein [Phycisphaerales bacterium]|nr:DinB family protein [Phycisphaerales bacterium]
MNKSDEFDPDLLIDRLAGYVKIVESIVQCVHSCDAKWKPDESTWSVLEIVCHLCDEEVEDFRTRVLMTLEQPAEAWPSIDPQGWVLERDYSSRDIKVQVDRFVQLRNDSVEILRALRAPAWSNIHYHPVFGSFQAGQMLACWVDHDALHLRQLAKRLHELAIRDGGNVSTEYAGTW